MNYLSAFDRFQKHKQGDTNPAKNGFVLEKSEYITRIILRTIV